MNRAIEGTLEDPLASPEDSNIRAMQRLVDKHEEEGLHLIEDKQLRLILAELNAVSLSNIIDLFEQDPLTNQIRVKNLRDIDRSVMAGVKSIKVRRDKLDGDIMETVEFTMHDKVNALDKLMRYHGAYIADNKQKKSKSEDMLEMVMSFIGSEGLPVIEDSQA